MLHSLRRLLTQNLWLKLLSVAIALLVWWAVAREPEAEVVIRVPIEFYHVPQDLQFSSENIPEAQIRVRGPAHTIREVTQSDIHPVIDLGGAMPGERTYNIRARGIRFPSGVEIEQIVPAQIRLTFDRPAQRMVPVHARISGTFASGYQIVATGVAPSEVRIDGPSRRVALIDSVITDPVDATGVIGSATFTANAYTTDPLVKISNPEPIRVTVVTQKAPPKAGVR